MEERLTYSSWRIEQVNDLQSFFKESLDVLKWAFHEYEDDIVYACSFGAEGIVLIDLISRVKSNAKIVFLDTDLHFKSTYELIEQVEKRYPTLRIERLKPNLTLDQQTEKYGEKLWESDPDQCCHIRKVSPLSLELTGVSAWISGLRREQSEMRQKTNYLNRDHKFQAIKICPLIHWTWQEVWSYILLHELPYNVLHDQGYPSIGCEKCTFPVSDEHDLRSGRWENTGKTECGLHN